MVFFGSFILIVTPYSFVNFVMNLNSIFYFAEVYNASVIYNVLYFVTYWELIFYNFFIIVFLFVIGSILHMRYRDHFADFMKWNSDKDDLYLILWWLKSH